MKQDQFFVQLHLVATDLLDDSSEQKHHLQLQNSSLWITDHVCLSVSAGYSPLSLQCLASKDLVLNEDNVLTITH